jgi:serine/threonine protein kinase
VCFCRTDAYTFVWSECNSDFGLSGVKGSGPKEEEPAGTLFWMAPEVIVGGEYKTSADVYSYAIIIWEIYTRKEPYEV